MNRSEQFREYLLKRYNSDASEAEKLLLTAEKVPEILHDYLATPISEIYDLTDSIEIDDLRSTIKVVAVLKDQDMHAEPRYTEALKWYKRFVKSVADNSIAPVIGESSIIKDDNEVVYETPTIRKTIYIEGESATQLPKEIQLRNRELRDACIAHFRSLHGGHIVCECCGFDFAKAYTINDDYIEVHHLHPFSHTDGEREVNAVKDLVPLCANCHRMIHHGQGGHGNCMPLEELKKSYKGIIYNK